MDRRLGANWRSRWRFETDVPVTAPRRTCERFRSATASPPVLYECEREGRARLYAGEGQWTLGRRTSDGTRRLEQVDGGDAESAAQVLS